MAFPTIVAPKFEAPRMCGWLTVAAIAADTIITMVVTLGFGRSAASTRRRDNRRAAGAAGDIMATATTVRATTARPTMDGLLRSALLPRHATIARRTMVALRIRALSTMRAIDPARAYDNTRSSPITVPRLACVSPLLLMAGMCR